MPTTLTATAEPANDPPRVLVQLEWTGQTSVTVLRVDPDGRSRPVRLAEPAALVAGVWTGYDYESWLDRPATYTATVGATTITSSAVTLAGGGVPWLRHPGVPSLSLPVEPLPPLEERTHAVNQAVLRPLGRRYPIVVTDGRRKSAASSILFRTESDEDAEAFRALLDDVAVLLLDVPADYGLGFTHEYLAIGEVRERRFDPKYGPTTWRNWSLPYEIVDRPAGGIQAERTWADVLAEASTWAQVKSMYDTWTDVLTGNTS